MKSLQKRHWLVHVLRRAGIAGADTLALDPGMRPARAWTAACDATGLTPGRLAVLVADYFRLAVASLDDARAAATRLVPPKIARQYGILPLRETDRHIVVATADPTDFAAQQALTFLSGRETIFEVAPPPAIHRAIEERYRAAPDPGIGATPAAGRAPDPAAGGRPTADSERAPNSDEASGGEGVTLGRVEGGTPILVVDDDPEDRLLVRTILQKEGFQVHEARDGAEALDRIGTGGAYSLIVLDLEMPRVDGRDVLARLRGSGDTAALPVLILTGSPDPEDEIRLMEGGADDYLRKPIDPPRFSARVRAALRRARLR